MSSYLVHQRRTSACTVAEAVAAAATVRDELVGRIRALAELWRGAPIGSDLAEGLRADIRRGLERLRGVDLAAADELEMEILDPGHEDHGRDDAAEEEEEPHHPAPPTWHPDEDSDAPPDWGEDEDPSEPFAPPDDDEDRPRCDPTGPTARALAARHACGTIAETAAGCFYADDQGTLFCQPHPSGREEDDLPDRVRIGAMVWYPDEGRWVAEPRHEGHELDMPTWGVVEDVAEIWARQFWPRPAMARPG